MQIKKPFYKITFEDIDIASEFFDYNQKHLSEFIMATIAYYSGKNVEIKSKIVEKYFKTYKKTMDSVILAKESGLKGAILKAENQLNNTDTLEGDVKDSLKDTPVTNNKTITIKEEVLSINDNKNKNKYGKNSNILLSKSEYLKLCTDYSKEKADHAIDYLSDWGIEKPSKFKEYKNHNLTLRRWVFEALEKNKPNNSKPDIVGGVDVQKWFESSIRMISQDLRTAKEHNQVVKQNGYDPKYLIAE